MLLCIRNQKPKLNRNTLGCTKSIALLMKVINLSLSVRSVRFHFFLPSLREKKRAASRYIYGSASSRTLDVDGLVNVLVFLLFSSLFFLSIAVQRERNDGPARSMDGGWFCATRGVEFSCSSEQARGKSSPRGAYRRDTRVGVVACRYHRGCIVYV